MHAEKVYKRLKETPCFTCLNAVCCKELKDCVRRSMEKKKAVGDPDVKISDDAISEILTACFDIGAIEAISEESEDAIDDRTFVNPERVIERNDSIKALRFALELLTPREEAVLTDRFGLNDGRPKSLEEVGASMGVTRHRVLQIESKAIRKMRGRKMLAVLRGAPLPRNDMCENPVAQPLMSFDDYISKSNKLRVINPVGELPRKSFLELNNNDLNELGFLSVRTYNRLKRAGFSCLEDLVEALYDLTEEKCMRLKKVGIQTV